jgi:hypothetical protein
MNHRATGIAAILMAAVLTGLFATTPLTYADESETNTDQETNQKNVGSGDSNNNNCAKNEIDSDTEDNFCEFNNSQPVAG